jgi:hypothetical protein
MPEFVEQLLAIGHANPLFAAGAVVGMVLILSAVARSR